MKKISIRSWVELHLTIISYIPSFNYSYWYEINLIRITYTANSSILYSKEKTVRILGTSLRGRRSKGKGKGIRARDHALSRAKFPLPLPLLTPKLGVAIWSWLVIFSALDNEHFNSMLFRLGKTYKAAHSSATLETLKSISLTKLLEKLLTWAAHTFHWMLWQG